MISMRAFLFAYITSVLAGTVSVDIHRDNIKGKHIGRGDALFLELHRRNSQSDYFEPLTNAGMGYFATIYVGSDRQKVIPIIDTGSSDQWVMASSNPYCADQDCTGMTFNPSTSSTFENTTKPWDIEYLEMKGAYGFLCKDTVEIGGASVPDAYVAVADVASITTDVFGVGYRNGEGTVRLNKTTETLYGSYPNYPVSLKNDGFINTIAYSLYLNNLDAQDGAILFGGVDHAKYYGTLGIVPIFNMAPQVLKSPFTFSVILNSISVKSDDHSCPLVSDFAVPVLLDSGTTFAMLPNETTKAMADAYGFTFDNDWGFFVGNCSPHNFDAFELNFSGVNVSIPAESLLAPGPADGLCILAIQSSDILSNIILGDVFLRNLYVVYDLENNQIALGQAKYTDESDVEEIVSTIPSATSAPYYSSTELNLDSKIHSATACETKAFTIATQTWPNEYTVQSSLYYSGLSATATSM